MADLLPVVGKPAPDFSLQSTSGEVVSLKQFKGKSTLVLYFYPADDTPGCTKEACAFRDMAYDFKQVGAVIYGVSPDTIDSHAKFQFKHQLPFDLLSDPDEALCELFGVMKMKNMYGKQVRGIERSTFLIDPNGVLRHEWRGVKVPGHVDEVLATLRALQGD